MTTTARQYTANTGITQPKRMSQLLEISATCSNSAFLTNTNTGS